MNFSHFIGRQERGRCQKTLNVMNRGSRFTHFCNLLHFLFRTTGESQRRVFVNAAPSLGSSSTKPSNQASKSHLCGSGRTFCASTLWLLFQVRGAATLNIPHLISLCISFLRIIFSVAPGSAPSCCDSLRSPELWLGSSLDCFGHRWFLTGSSLVPHWLLTECYCCCSAFLFVAPLRPL